MSFIALPDNCYFLELMWVAGQVWKIHRSYWYVSNRWPRCSIGGSQEKISGYSQDAQVSFSFFANNGVVVIVIIVVTSSTCSLITLFFLPLSSSKVLNFCLDTAEKRTQGRGLSKQRQIYQLTWIGLQAGKRYSFSQVIICSWFCHPPFSFEG